MKKSWFATKFSMKYMTVLEGNRIGVDSHWMRRTDLEAFVYGTLLSEDPRLRVQAKNVQDLLRRYQATGALLDHVQYMLIMDDMIKVSATWTSDASSAGAGCALNG